MIGNLIRQSSLGEYDEQNCEVPNRILNPAKVLNPYPQERR